MPPSCREYQGNQCGLIFLKLLSCAIKVQILSCQNATGFRNLPLWIMLLRLYLGLIYPCQHTVLTSGSTTDRCSSPCAGKWAPARVCLLTSCRCIWCIHCSRTTTSGIPLSNFPYPGPMDSSKYKVSPSDSPSSPRSQSLSQAEVCPKAKKHPLRNTGILANFRLNENIQPGHKVSHQSRKKFCQTAVRPVSTDSHIHTENQIQATLDKNTKVQTENQKYNWHARYW